jgi:hypothetical protein
MPTRAPRNFRLPDPWLGWFHTFVEECQSTDGVPATPTSAVWGSANVAKYLPVVFPVDALVYNIQCAFGSGGTDNYDLGLYNPDYSAIARKGSTVTAAGLGTLTMPRDIRVRAGDTYYVGFVMSGTTNTVLQMAAIGGTGPQLNGGAADQASALPLPDPMVPASPGTLNLFPIISIGIR